MVSDLDYLRILKALMELPFQVGKNLLMDFLLGDYSNNSVTKNRLDELNNFDSLNWERGRLSVEIDRLIANGMIEMVTSDYNRFVKVLSLTIRGRNEITHPTLPEKKLANKVDFKVAEISEEDRARFKKFVVFLDGFNDEQKKAIVSESLNLLCVAGAGSGKTTVLTKRIEFLVKHREVSPEKILAITFTRKARQEMERRLYDLGVSGVRVHTFNSFCEGILQRHGARIYGRPIRVQTYQDKILAMNVALASMGLSMEDAISGYFSLAQRKFKSGTQMANSFMNDCFSVMDYFKVTGEAEYDFSRDADEKNRHNAQRIYRITQFLKRHMEVQGLRDFSDQIIDAIKFLKESPDDVPRFEHVLVDEYQDVNAMQIELLGLLKPRNLFAVGDPRQSIFGWRGSDINYILKFEKDYENVEVIHLTKNYRSGREIVEFMNHSIKEMGLPNLEHHNEFDNVKIRILDFENEEAERTFVLRNIVDGDVPRGEIFVLARTNRQLMELSRLMKAKGISHVVKTDEVRSPVDVREGDVTLATVHAIKGLEAKKVFVIGANEQNFPCKASDHPAIEMVKTESYDREEEERRLFYVAISRAKKILYVTYTKKPTYYISDEMKMLAGGGSRVTSGGSEKVSDEVDEGIEGELKSWRAALSEERGVPAYRILTNATIEEIARKMPRSAEELVKINGIGPAKLMEYGAKILDIVNEVWG